MSLFHQKVNKFHIRSVVQKIFTFSHFGNYWKCQNRQVCIKKRSLLVLILPHLGSILPHLGSILTHLGSIWLKYGQIWGQYGSNMVKYGQIWLNNGNTGPYPIPDHPPHTPLPMHPPIPGVPPPPWHMPIHHELAGYTNTPGVRYPFTRLLSDLREKGIWTC